MSVLLDDVNRDSEDAIIQEVTSNDSKLQDIEQQMELAESRCNYLKDQLDVMKQVYEKPKTRKFSTAKMLKSSTGGVEEPETLDLIKHSKQKSIHIDTDHTGAAVKTINNILNGITNSVNRLTEIHSQLTTPRVTRTTAVPIDEDIKTESTEILISKKSFKRKPRTSKTVSQQSLKRSMKFDKKQGPTSTRLSAHHSLKPLKPLVEIYHNEALKHSDSNESNFKKSKQCEREITHIVPPLNLPQEVRTLYVDHDILHAPKTTVSCCFSRNYEQPTAASKLKQVAKSYLGSLSIKTIPFCAAISTTQSHNIGINIQQVMNIIRNRQPINGISPTLVHNIGLAAEKMQCKPFNAMISTINSRISQTMSKCPLSRTFLNIPQLQEMAKNIPEETIEEADENEEFPETHTMIITGPSGDMEVTTKTVPNWMDDSNIDKCTCINEPNGNFQQIANKYRQDSQFGDNNTDVKKKFKRFKSTSKHSAIIQSNEVIKEDTTLNCREKNLKEVLSNLHNDFESLNKRYNELSTKAHKGSDESTIKELERLEAELGKKEEEITMVMNLYKEVLALKHNVQNLKEQRSLASIQTKDIAGKIKFREYNNPEAAFHLTKLLKQIQHYQLKYKSKLTNE